jgi:TfoX/Sxy family transcriptional regulator of competence genes
VTPQELFDAVAEDQLGDPGVHEAKMFGSPGLKVGKRFYASLVKGRLVVKLPADRVDALEAKGGAEHFDPGMGRRMREWAAIEPGDRDTWVTLAREARAFVGDSA